MEASAPKKLKLTLKLNNRNNNSSSNNNSDSSSSLPSSTPTSTANSNINSSTPVSPVKESSSTSAANVDKSGGLVDLPSGLANLKGRGRPKKSSATATGATISNEPSELTTTVPSTTSDYLAELKSFVASMKTFKPRSWSLKRPVSLVVKNVAGYEISLPAGLWCTSVTEPASSHLRVSSTTTSEDSTPSSSSAVNPASAAFETKCQCGKVFTDKSKYRKHVKIHEKASVPAAASVPTISLKLKLNNNQ